MGAPADRQCQFLIQYQLPTQKVGR